VLHQPSPIVVAVEAMTSPQQHDCDADLPVEPPHELSAVPRKPSQRRKRRTEYLHERRNGQFYFVRRYPVEYIERGYFKGPAMRKSLFTRDRDVAAVKCRDLAVRFDRVMAALAARDLRRSGGGEAP